MLDNVDIGGDTLPKPVCDDRAGTDVGNYTLQERLGAGGMAAVYRAIHRGFDEIVAVKLLAPRFGAQPEMLRRFLREAVVMREISARNNHVVRCLDFGQSNAGEAYLVMDYLTGQDLQQLVTTVGPLAWDRVVPLALQLCDALATTHAHGIIHRDIKPSNCLLTEEDGEQRLKLIDFGIAKDLGGDQTDANLVLGTPSYLAPELLAGAAPDARSDIYAVGATLYCLLTGRPPYVGRIHRVIAEKQQHEDLIPPSQDRPAELPRVPPGADAIILRALDLDPDRRFQSAMDLADELRHSLEPHPGTRQLAGPALGIRVAWLSALVASLIVVFTIGAGTAARRPAPAPFVSAGIALAEPANQARLAAAKPPAPSHTVLDPVPSTTPPAPATPVPSDTSPVPSHIPDPPGPSHPSAASVTAPAVPSHTPPPAPVPSDSQPALPSPSRSTPGTTSAAPPASAALPAPVPSDSPASRPPPSVDTPTSPQPPSVDTPPSPPATTDPQAAAPVDPRTQRVRRILDKQRETLRRECRDLSGGTNRLRFTLTLARGALEAVAAQPGTFRECVRNTLRDISFGVDGQYDYTFSAASG